MSGDESEIEPRGFATRAIHAGAAWNSTYALTPPIFQTSTFRLPDAAAGAAFSNTMAPAEFYTRWGNPNQKAVEETLASLEGAESALVFSSGMGAIAATLFSLVRPGDHVLVGRSIYSGSAEITGGLLPSFGVETTSVDTSDGRAIADAIRPTTRVLLFESPTNPVLEVADFAEVAAICRERGVTTVIDNTFATPYNQNPIAAGIDVVVHSATKSLGGHSDLTAGVVCSRRDVVEGAWRYLKLFGACISPFEAWLLLRGLKTLALRAERQNESSLAIARHLENHPRVKRAWYPGLTSHPGHEIAKRQMRGFGGVVTVEIDGSREAVAGFVESLRLFRLAVSLGGAESLVQHPATMTHGMLSPAARAAAGIDDGLVRLAIGLEDVEDLTRDLDRALDRMGSGGIVRE